MEFEPLFLEIEHKIGKLEKMAQRFTGVTESVDEFRRRHEKLSKQQQSINKALFDLKRQHDEEQDRIRRGLSPQEAKEEKLKEREAARAQQQLLKQQSNELNSLHNAQMKYLDDNLAMDPSNRNSLSYKQQQVLSKKRGSVEVSEEEIERAKSNNNDNELKDDELKDDDQDDDNKSDLSNLSSKSAKSSETRNITNEKETKRLQNTENTKKQTTLNKLKQRKDIRSVNSV